MKSVTQNKKMIKNKKWRGHTHPRKTGEKGRNKTKRGEFIFFLLLFFYLKFTKTPDFMRYTREGGIVKNYDGELHFIRFANRTL